MRTTTRQRGLWLTAFFVVAIGCGLMASRPVFAYTYALAFWSSARSGPFCSNLAGGTWVAVPGNTLYGTAPFCVQKYIPSATNTSQPNVSPRVSISQTDARTACSALGSEYHLITNPEWMTIAANIANVGSNWSGGSVGNGSLSRGHSDNNPASVCAADANDSNAWVESNCTASTQGAQQFNQRRTQNLSNAHVIWDFGGNVWQWVDYNNTNDKPTPAQAAWYEFTAITGSTTTPKAELVPLNSTQSWWTDSWNSTQAIGKIVPDPNGSGGALGRGASWSATVSSGLFAAHLGLGPSVAYSDVSFRCAYTPTSAPTSYTVTYNGNSHTGGNVPTDPLRYIANDPVTVIGNVSSLARTGYTFTGWNTQADGNGTPYNAGQNFSITANTTLYAKWTPAYNVTYSGNGNTSGSAPVDNTLYLTSQSATILNNTGSLTRTGYTFSGWNTSPNGNGTSYTAGSTLTIASANIVLYAVWIDSAIAGMASTLNGWGWLMQCTTNPDGNSMCYGPGSYSSSKTLPGLSNKQYNLNVSIYVRTGTKIYSGGSNDGSWWQIGGSPAGHSHWEWFRLSIASPANTYYVNRGTVEDYNTYNINYAKTLTVNGGTTISTAAGAADTVIKSGGAFTYLGSYYSRGGQYGTLTVSATTPLNYLVFYDGNGNTSGSVPSDSTAYTAGTTVTTRSNTGALTRTGYIFNGWNTAADGSGTSYAAGTASFAMPANDLTLFAQWSLSPP